MSYMQHTIENPSLLKRFSHTKRFDIALELLAVKADDKILDYGTGDGFMLKKLLSSNPKKVVGYEPIESSYIELVEFIRNNHIDNVVITGDLNLFETNHFDKVCCLEVLEHLTEANQLLVLTTIKKLLNKKGVAVISVPIEVGLSGLLKNLVRFFLRQSHPNTTALNVLKSFFGMKIDRGSDEYILSHIGFNYHDLEKVIASAGYTIKQRCFSPLPGLKGFLNSQVFYVLEN